MTSSDFGTSGSSRPDVESSIRGLSSDSDGIFVGCEPVARMQCSNDSSVSPPAPATVIDRGPVNVPRPCRYFDLPQLGDLADATRQPVHDSLLEGSQLVDIHRRLVESDSPRRRVPGLVNDLGDVEQRLRRDASAVEADAPGVLFLVDERDLHAEVSGIERCRIAARPGAENRNVCRFACHQPMRDSRKGCSMASTTQRRKRMASAPSITRWSYDSESGSR